MSGPESRSIPDIARELWLERLATGQTGQLKVISGSMAPMLKLGDSLRVIRGGRWYAPGTLVIFTEAEKLICHRLMWWARPGVFLQKGDLDPGWGIVRTREIVGVAREIVVENKTAPLYGLNYHYHNLWVWLLVAGRDLVQYLGKNLKIKGMHTISAQMTRRIAEHIDSIRIFKGES